MIVVHVTTAHRATDNRINAKECRALIDEGFEVHLIAPSGSDGGSHHVRIPHRRQRLLRFALGPWDVLRPLLRIRPDLIHIHDPELIPLGILVKALTDSVVIYDAHEDLPLQVQQAKPYIPRVIRRWIAPLARALEVSADRQFDAIIVATARLALNYHGPRVTIVQNFPWRPADVGPNPASVSPWIIAYVGVISETRGALDMIAALSRTPVPVQLRLAGPVRGERVRKAIDEATVGTIDYRGVITPAQVPAFLHGCVAGLAVLHPLPNYLEAQSTKIYEYMAARVPFIASNFPAWVRQLAPYSAGEFIEPKDPTLLAHAIARACDEQQALELGTRGRSAVESTFCFEQEAQALIDLYKSLSNSRVTTVQNS